MTLKKPYYKTNTGVIIIIFLCCLIGILILSAIGSITSFDNTVVNNTDNITRKKLLENLTYKDEVSEVLSQFDIDDDFKISEVEFRVWAIKSNIDKDSRNEIFKKYDSNKDQYLDIYELNAFREIVESY